MSKGTWIYVGGFELPDCNAAAHRVRANARILQQLGYEVILVGVRKQGAAGLVRYPENYDGCECWSVRRPTTRKQWVRYILGSHDLDSLISASGSDLRGIICYNYPAVAQLRLFNMSKRSGGKRLADLTEWYEAGAGPWSFRLVKWIDTLVHMRIINRLADGIIAISPMLAQLYLKHGIPVVQIPPLFDTQQVEAPNNFNQKDGPVRLIYIGSPFTAGRVRRDKMNVKDRLDICIKILSKLAAEGAKFEFNIYGVHREQYLAIFAEDKALLDAHRDRIRFHGRIDNQEARSYLAASDYSIFIRDPTRVNLAGFPTKLSESVSIGTPVITSSHSNLQGFSDTPGVFLVDRSDEYARLKCLLSISRPEIRKMKIKTYEARTFDFRNYVDRMRQFLGLVLS